MSTGPRYKSYDLNVLDIFLPDINIILGALSQMERELIVHRVKAGLENARRKGVRIGRKKERNSDLIRALLKKGLSYRSIASIAECSHGSIYAEKKQMLKEEAEKIQKEEELKRQKEELGSSFPDIELPPVSEIEKDVV